MNEITINSTKLPFAEFASKLGGDVIYVAELGEKAYTKADFVELCKGLEDVAYRLYSLCEWQHPTTLLDEDMMAQEGDICFPELFCADAVQKPK